jgi:hypothetical protein
MKAWLATAPLSFSGSLAIARKGDIDLARSCQAAEKRCGDPDEEVRVAARDAMADILRAIELRGVS